VSLHPGYGTSSYVSPRSRQDTDVRVHRSVIVLGFARYVLPQSRGKLHFALKNVSASAGCSTLTACLETAGVCRVLEFVIHAAGNTEATAMLTTYCLQSVPMLGERELLVWAKGRAQGVAPMSPTHVKKLKGGFVARHGLPPFAIAAIRSTVLTTAYRASGDLLIVKEIANHQHLSTTIDYVRGPEAIAAAIDDFEHGPVFTDSEFVAGKQADDCPNPQERQSSWLVHSSRGDVCHLLAERWLGWRRLRDSRGDRIGGDTKNRRAWSSRAGVPRNLCSGTHAGAGYGTAC